MIYLTLQARPLFSRLSLPLPINGIRIALYSHTCVLASESCAPRLRAHHICTCQCILVHTSILLVHVHACQPAARGASAPTGTICMAPYGPGRAHARACSRHSYISSIPSSVTFIYIYSSRSSSCACGIRILVYYRPAKNKNKKN